MQARLREAVSLEKHVLLKVLLELVSAPCSLKSIIEVHCLLMRSTLNGSELLKRDKKSDLSSKFFVKTSPNASHEPIKLTTRLQNHCRAFPLNETASNFTSTSSLVT